MTVSQFMFFATTNACTTFVLKDSTHLVYGRNFDWDISSGFIVINKKGIAKQAFVQPPNKPANWISKYGSITFNQIGIDAPMGGMNEKGLVISQMALFESKFPKPDDKPVVGCLDWIQYQLDNSSTLAEVIEKNENIRISSDMIPVHYFICDSLGNVGIIEYIDGELVIHEGADVSIQVCSNMIYEKSKKVLTEYSEFGGQKDIPTQWHNVPDIIAIANSKVCNYKLTANSNPIEYGFEILTAVGSNRRSQWSIIYDIKNKSINFISLENKNVRTISMNSFEYVCNSDIQILDIQKSNNETDIAKQFTSLTYDFYFDYKKNLIELYKANMKGFPDIPHEVIKLEVEYAMNRKCE